MSLNMEIPYDIIAHIARFCERRGVVNIALTCHDVKNKVDQVCWNNKVVALEQIPSELKNNNRVGKLSTVRITNDSSNISELLQLLPSSVKNLQINSNNRLTYQLPSTIKEIVFGSLFEQSIPDGWLPPTLRHLRFYLNYNRDLSTIHLPETLKSLHFGSGYSHPYPTFPPNLKKLLLMSSRNKYHRKIVLPSGLEMLWSTHPDTSKLELPSSLKALSFGRVVVKKNRQSLVNVVSFSVNALDCSGVNLRDVHLPDSIKFLRLQALDTSESITNFSFPPKLKELSLGGVLLRQHSFRDMKLPRKLRKITFPYSFNDPLEDTKIPNSVEVIKFGSGMTQPVTNLRFPSNLKKIIVGRSYTCEVDKSKLGTVELVKG